MFTVATGMQPSAVRSCIMAPSTGRRPFSTAAATFTHRWFGRDLHPRGRTGRSLQPGVYPVVGAVLGLVLFYPVCALPFRRFTRTIRCNCGSAFGLGDAIPGCAAKPVQAGRGLPRRLVGIDTADSLLFQYIFVDFDPRQSYRATPRLSDHADRLPFAGAGSLSLWVGDIFNHANAVLVLLFAWFHARSDRRAVGALDRRFAPVWVLAAFYLLSGIWVWRVRVQSNLEKPTRFDE